MARGNHYRRSSQLAGSSIVLAVAIIIGAGVGVGIWALTSHQHHTKTATDPSSSATTLPAQSTTLPAQSTTLPDPSTTRPASSTTRPAPSTTRPDPSATTVPAIPPPVVSSDSVTYTLPAGTPVKVTAVNRCWVQVRASASAPVTQETILAAGQVITVPSPLWIRFGDPTSATAVVGTTQLQLPQLAGELIVVSPAT